MNMELDCSLMTDRAAAHDYLKQQFGFPDYYGRNLDALYDLLTAWGTELTVAVCHTELLEENLGGYGSALLAAIREAAEENPRLTLMIQ